MLTGCRAAQAELPPCGFPDLGCGLGGDYGASALGCAPPEHSGAAEVPDIARLGGRAGSLLSACEARVPSVVMAALVTDARPLYALRRTSPHAPLDVCDDEDGGTRGMVWLPDADGLPVERGAVRMVKAEVKAEARGDWARETCDCVLGEAPVPKQAQRPGRAPAPSHAPAPRRRRAALVALARMRSGVSDDEAGAGSGDDSGADSDAGGKDVTDGDDSDGADTRLARRERRARAGTCAGGGTGQPRPAVTREEPAAGARTRAAGLLYMVEGCRRGGTGAGGTSHGIPRGWQFGLGWQAYLQGSALQVGVCAGRRASDSTYGVRCGLIARAQIAGGTGGVARHACLQRYRAKKARRLFTNTVRYAARKANADRRPRVKGRFVKASELAAYLAAQA